MLNQGITFFVPLILVPYTSRTLGADNIGIYSYTFSIVTIFSSLGRLGLNTYGELQASHKRDDKNAFSTLVWELMSLKIVFTIINIIIYSLFIFWLNEYRSVSIIMIIYLVADMVDISWIYHGLENFKLVAIRGLIVRFLNLILVILFVHGKNDLYRYTFIMQITVLLANITLWYGLKKYVSRPRLYFNANTIVHLLKCLIYFIPTIANMIYNMLDKTMLGYIGQSTLESGYYEQAYKIVSAAQSVILAIGTTTLPRLTYLYKTERKKEFEGIISKTMKVNSMLLCPMMIGLVVNADIIVRTVLGEEFLGSIKILQILGVLLFFASFNYNIGNQILVSVEKQSKYNIGVLAGAAVNLILNILLIPRLYATGAAIGSLAAEVIIFAIFIIFSKSVIPLGLVIQNNVWKFFLAAAVMGVADLGIKHYVKAVGSFMQLMVILPVSVIIYFLILYILKERTWLESIQENFRHKKEKN